MIINEGESEGICVKMTEYLPGTRVLMGKSRCTIILVLMGGFIISIGRKLVFKR